METHAGVFQGNLLERHEGKAKEGSLTADREHSDPGMLKQREAGS